MCTARNRLVSSGLMAALLFAATMQARASVVVCDRDFSAHQDSGLLLEVPGTETGFGASHRAPDSLLVIDATSGGEPIRTPSPSDEIDGSFGHCPVGMLPSSSSLSQVGGSGVGGAAVSNVKNMPCDSLRATLSPESRTVLPAGPVFRWFRPPRNWS
jgi:hypothetical protein